MDEPTVSVHVAGSHHTETGTQFPTSEVECRNLYLRHALTSAPEPLGTEYTVPESFTQPPVTLTNDTALISWATATFMPGHRLVAELPNNEPMSDEHNSLLPPDAFHLPIGRAATTTVYRDVLHESRLLLPYVK